MRPEWQFLQDTWQFIAFLFGGIFAFVLGRERQRWRIDQLGEKVSDLDRRITGLEEQGHVEAVTLAEIRTTQTTILDALAELRADLKGKADK